MKKLAIFCIAMIMCVSLSGCAFLRSMVPTILDHVITPKATSTPRYVQSTPVPKATPKPASTQTATPAPTATPTAEPEESQPQGIQFPIAP